MKQEGRDNMEVPDSDWSIILKRILKKESERLWTGFI
jgi:hypothetical protein